MRKLLCAILTMAMALMLVAPAFALTDTVPAGFTPIYTPEDLDAIRDDLDGDYILMNDIDMGGWGEWEPVGMWDGNYPSGAYFSGILDGNGYEIRNLKIDCSEPNIEDTENTFVGLFAVLAGTVKNLGIVNASIRAGFEAEFESAIAGGIAGFGAWAQVENCYVTGEIAACASPRAIAGGLIGCAGDGAGAGVIRSCYSVVSLTVTQDSELCLRNGIALAGATDGLIANCYSNFDPVAWGYYGPIDATNTATLTLGQMKQQASFAGFDWSTPMWYIKEGETYPKLRPFPEAPTYFPDAETGIAVDAPEGTFEPGTVMEVDEQDAGNFVLGPGNSVHAVYDIKFVKDNAAVQPNGKVTVRLPFKDVNPGTSANWKVYYVERDAQGNITKKIDMDAKVVQTGGVYYWEFETDHFSLYAVVDEEIVPAEAHFWDGWPDWAVWLLKYVLFGWVWMRWF